jgi:transcription antitermination factor NusG
VDSHEFHETVSGFGCDGLASSRKWYAAFTVPRHEKRLTTHCAERQIESFLPLYQVRHKWKNRCTATIELPLFPNYCFVRIDPQERVQVLKLPGVLSIVSSGRQLLPIPDDYITSLRGGLLAHRIEPHPNVEAGDRVGITTGPMAGMEGVLVRQKNEFRVILRLEMIGRSVAVEVGAEEISYLGKSPTHPPLLAWHELAKPGTAGLCP